MLETYTKVLSRRTAYAAFTKQQLLNNAKDLLTRKRNKLVNMMKLAHMMQIQGSDETANSFGRSSIDTMNKVNYLNVTAKLIVC